MSIEDGEMFSGIDYPGQWKTKKPDGMTLRDYFAGQAINGVMSSGVMPDLESVPRIAERAYVLADAMLKARGEK